jgi:hypothetical protein
LDCLFTLCSPFFFSSRSRLLYTRKTTIPWLSLSSLWTQLQLLELTLISGVKWVSNVVSAVHRPLWKWDLCCIFPNSLF